MNLINRFLKLCATAAAAALSVSLAAAPLTVMAESDYKIILTQDGLEDYYGEMIANEKMPVQTNKVPSWPKGPAVSAAGAVVMDADSGTVLYAKNQDMRLYPASITKIMTGLLACENLNPSDMVTFSENAVFGIESGSSNIGMDVGESITVEQALYGLMIASANEVSVALGERVSGSEPEFIDLMNRRASELGCKNTHFVTANGLHDDDHYTTAYDMALIAREVWKHQDLVNYMSQNNYHFEASDTQPDDFWLGNTNDFLNGAIPCEDVIGGKTGYTDQARETLVTFASRGDMNLICVVMRNEPPHQYYDTIDLLDYGFEHFKRISIAGKEDRFTLQPPEFQSLGEDIFGQSGPFYTIPAEASLTIPEKASFSDLSAVITPSYVSPEPEKAQGEDGSEEKPEEEQQEKEKPEEEKSEEENKKEEQQEEEKPEEENKKEESQEDEKQKEENKTEEQQKQKGNGKRILGTINYAFHDYPVGTADVLFSDAAGADGSETAEEVHGIRAVAFSLVHKGAHDSLYLNILLLIPLVLAVSFILCIIFFIHSYFSEINRRRKSSTRRARQALQSEESSRQYGTYDSEEDMPRLSGNGNSRRGTNRRPSRYSSSEGQNPSGRSRRDRTR